VSFEPTPDDIADRYVDARARILDIARGMSKDDLAVTVPGTPKWTLHNLLSHLAGVTADFAAGRLEGAGSDAWTQRQVDARTDHTLDQLLEEWDNCVGGVESATRAGQVPSPIAFDILTHESDIRGALGIEVTADPLARHFIADGFGARAIGVAAGAGLPPLQMTATDSDWSIGEPGGVTAAAPEAEWTRALTGRRSNAQVARFDWSDDPAPYLDLLSPFGPLRETDVAEG
jgi:uncharacterized protein (TIGR03083 family)